MKPPNHLLQAGPEYAESLDTDASRAPARYHYCRFLLRNSKEPFPYFTPGYRIRQYLDAPETPMKRMKRLYLLLGLLALVIALIPFKAQLRGVIRPLFGQGGRKTVADQLKDYGPAVRKRLAPAFKASRNPARMSTNSISA